MKKIVFLIVILLNIVACSSPNQTINNINEAVGLKKLGTNYCEQYTKQAQNDSLPKVALLFKALSSVENIHEQNFIELLKEKELGIKDTLISIEQTTDSTLTNIYRVYVNSQYEYYNLYPEYIETAKKEGFRKAVKAFESAMQSTLSQISIMQATIDSLEKNSNENSLAKQWYVCNKCGNLTNKSVDNNEKCEICKGSSFLIFKL